MNKPIWTPSGARTQQANMAAFIQHVRECRAGGDALCPDAGAVRTPDECAAEGAEHPGKAAYDTLYAWSIAHPQQFWAAVWRFCGIVAEGLVGRASAPASKNHGQGRPRHRWFSGARLNFAENLLRHCHDEDASTHEALVSWNENGRQKCLTYARLYSEVAQVAAALREAGVEAGDRVAGFMPNIPETVIAMLAAASRGAIWSSCSPDFGVKGVLDRFGQIRPKVLFCAAGYLYNGKHIDCLERVRGILAQLPEIERVVVVPFMDTAPEISSIPRAVTWNDFVGASDSSPGDTEGRAEIQFAQLPFDHPLYIMYSSGTTGLPKCMVHGAGGTLIQHLKELALHTDLTREDRIFYFTTCGWMMWNWLVSSLAVGATVLLYDGSPFAPKPDILWDMAEQERMSVFGTSAKYLVVLEKHGVKPRQSHDVSALRCILSTGSPLAPESFDYAYRDIKEDLQLASISGGTDIISCFALGNPIGPVWRGELQCRGLGMKVEVFDDEGKPVSGKPGELVCTAPFPSMPVSFWNDPDGSKYRAAYYEHYPGVWRHGDWVELTEHGGLIIHGRSDATLNPGGVRIGTAEIYNAVEQFPEVLEGIVVGQDWEGDVRIVLFVRLQEGAELTDELRERIRKKIRQDCSPHHVPKKIIAVADIPRTISGKIVELAVRNVIHGRAVKNIDALANPEALELYKGLKELGE